jgi:hypothetical protein
MPALGATPILKGDGLADLERGKNALGLLRGCRHGEHHEDGGQQRKGDEVLVHVIFPFSDVR